jgi:hypothetical protein
VVRVCSQRAVDCGVAIDRSEKDELIFLAQSGAAPLALRHSAIRAQVSGFRAELLHALAVGPGIPPEADVLFIDRSGRVVRHEVELSAHTLLEKVNAAKKSGRDYLGELRTFKDAGNDAYVVLAEQAEFWLKMFGRQRDRTL